MKKILIALSLITSLVSSNVLAKNFTMHVSNDPVVNNIMYLSISTMFLPFIKNHMGKEYGVSMTPYFSYSAGGQCIVGVTTVETIDANDRQELPTDHFFAMTVNEEKFDKLDDCYELFFETTLENFKHFKSFISGKYTS